MLRQALKKGLTPIMGRAEALPFRDGLFHIVLCIDAFHHFRDHGKAIAELKRVLHPSGRVFVQDFNRKSLLGRLSVLLERLLRFKSRFYTPLELERRFEEEGLRVAHREAKGFSFHILLNAGL
jgi:ubiquinone/menaquinone biosynthesis C-methylase UbiE